MQEEPQKPTPETPYGPDYYRCCLGPYPYERNASWLAAWARIAKRIQETLSPSTVLDSGCAMGMLVESLRDLGIEASGYDISSYAISQVRGDVAPHCRVGLVTDPIEGSWDLIVSIEVLEHVTSEECELALDRFASATDQVLFSSSPLDLTEKTHINVRPIRAWIEAFLARGFAPATGYDASYISPQAILFRRGPAPPEREIDLFAGLLTERCLRLDEAAQTQATLSNAQAELATARVALEEAQAEQARISRELQEARSSAARLVEDLRTDLRRGAVRAQRDAVEVTIATRSLAAARADLKEAALALSPRRGGPLLDTQTLWRTLAAALLPQRNRLRMVGLGWLVRSVAARAVAPYFDVGHYRPGGRSFGSRLEAASHYLRSGSGTGDAPNPYFDAAYYRARYPDVASSDTNPLLHYALFGYAEQRQPGPLFQPAWYRGETSTPPGARDPLALFLAAPDRAASPHPLFDVEYFLRQCPAARTDARHPLTYYLAEQGAWRLNTHPLFDGAFYLDRLPSDGGQGVAPLLHFVSEGAAAGINPHPLFDVRHYAALCADARDKWVNPLAHFLEFGARNLIPPHPLFDPEHYCSRHTPSAALYRNPLLHFLAEKARDRKSPQPLLDFDFYREAYGAMLPPDEDPLSHYLRAGSREGCDPNPGFRTAEYLAAHPELTDSRITPLEHFLRRAGRAGRFVEAGLCFQEPADRPRHNVPARTASVSIVVAVHNALDDVKRCLSSVLRHTIPPYEIVIVDDGSGEAAAEYLREFSLSQGARVIRNESAKGYTFAANQGMRSSKGDYVVLLNSDTIVTPAWLDRLVACAESDARIGLAGPLSNTASWQSVPELFEAGDWASNPLPEGIAIDDMARFAAAAAGQVYPRVRFLNGFCLLIRRAVLEEIGLFDEELFGAGYGEENDYCLRAAGAGWQLAVAEDAYVFHAQSRSYTSERRLALSRKADANLRARHGDEPVDRGVEAIRNNLALLGGRARVRAEMEREAIVSEARASFEGARVAFVLPVADAGGGANVILSEAAAMRRFGVDVRIVNLEEFRSTFERSYPECDLEVRYANATGEIARLCGGFDAVVATLYKSVFWIEPFARQGGGAAGYYVQDYEPDFFTPDSPEHRDALRSYRAYSGLRCFTKTGWNQERVLRNAGVRCAIVGPSFDTDLFRPRQEAGEDRRPLRVLAMVRPESPRRAARATVEILNRAIGRHGPKLEISVFGTDLAGYSSLGESGLREFRRYGKLTPEQCAALFATQDIFVDFSTFQAMGLTALECMASGCAVIVPANGGSGDFASHEDNALVVDTSDIDACERALDRLIEDAPLRTRLRQSAVAAVPRYFPERAAFKILSAVFGRDREGTAGA